MPATEPKSGFGRCFFEDVGGVAGILVSSAILWTSAALRRESSNLRRAGMNRALEFDYPADHFVGIFEHHEFLSVDQADHGVRGRFNVLDQVRIEDQRRVVDAGYVNHRGGRSLQRLSAAKRRM
jgi:hypothetical protein